MFDDYGDDFINEFGIISTRDCTGLMPALPQSEYEWESYQSLYSTELTGAGIVNFENDDIYPEDDTPDPNP